MFQLTTSRRGRRRGGHPVRTSGGFNSRPHEEVDIPDGEELPPFNVSTHDLTKRSTTSAFCYPTWPCVFQLTTSRRGRQQFLRKKFSFQNHFLCSLHIIYSYYINTIFFSTLFLAKSSFFLVRIL